MPQVGVLFPADELFLVVFRKRMDKIDVRSGI